MEKELQELLETLFKVVNDGTFIAFAAPLVVLLTAIVKRVPGLEDIRGEVISLFWQAVGWALYMFARHVGYDTQFETIAEAITLLLPVFFTSLLVTPRVYSAMRDVGVPILGYQRD